MTFCLFCMINYEKQWKKQTHSKHDMRKIQTEPNKLHWVSIIHMWIQSNDRKNTIRRMILRLKSAKLINMNVNLSISKCVIYVLYIATRACNNHNRSLNSVWCGYAHFVNANDWSLNLWTRSVSPPSALVWAGNPPVLSYKPCCKSFIYLSRASWNGSSYCSGHG